MWLRAHCDFLTERAFFSYSIDGENFKKLGGEFMMIYQGKTFQGIRYSLFSYHERSGAGETGAGGYADFDGFTLDEPRPSGFTRPIPTGKTVVLENMLDGSLLAAQADHVISVPKTSQPGAHSHFKVVDAGLGRVALETPAGLRITAAPKHGDSRVTLAPRRDDGDPSQTFQWTEMPHGQIMFLSLATNRHLRIQPNGGAVTADSPGASFDHSDGGAFDFRIVDGSR